MYTGYTKFHKNGQSSTLVILRKIEQSENSDYMHTFGTRICINHQVKLISISLKTVRGVRQTIYMD